MLYLASPYSHPDPAVRLQRYEAACRAAATLLHAGPAVYSPIVHSHPLVAHGLPTDWSFWSRFDQPFLEIADGMVVLMLVGWRDSVGVREELRIAEEIGIPVIYLEPDALIAENEKSPAVTCLALPSHQVRVPTGLN